MKIRLATPKDSSSLLKIYSEYINTPITFECTLPCTAAFSERIREITSFYPYLVCEKADKIIGYAYAHRQMERQAYNWNAELSVYIDSDFTSIGIGKKLYLILMEILKLQGIKTVYAGITLPNVKSEGLHKSLGFRQIGIYQSTGYKCGKWHDVAWFEKALAEYDYEPRPAAPIGMIPDEMIEKIIKKYS